MPSRGVRLSLRDSPLRMLLRSRLFRALQGIGALLVSGSAGYWLLGQLHYRGLLEPQLEEAWSLLDCVYMTVITVSTIGYGETLADLTQFPVVRMYTMSLILVGMLLVAYSVSSATAFFVNGDLHKLLSRRKTMKQISALSGHYIVCGCGVSGRVVVGELVATGRQVVVIDTRQSLEDEFAANQSVWVVDGDATEDETLLAAGVERAAGLAVALPNDKDNLFVVISARQLCPTIRIVSGASEHDVRDKLLRAGADGVVSGPFIGGLRLASELLRPEVVGFLDLMLRQDDGEVRFAQVDVRQEWVGKRLLDLKVAERTGLPVLAVTVRGTEKFVFNPAEDYVLAKGSVLVTMGETAAVSELERLVGEQDGATWIDEQGVTSGGA